MGAKCGKANCCSLRVQRTNLGCGLFKQPFGVGSCKSPLPPINGWQVRDKCLAAYNSFHLLYFEMQATKARLLPPHGPGIQVQLPIHRQPSPSSKASGGQIASDLPKFVGLDNHTSRTVEAVEPSETAAPFMSAQAEHASPEHARIRAAAHGIVDAGISDQSSSAGEQQPSHVIGAAVRSCCALPDPLGAGHRDNLSATKAVSSTDEDRHPNVRVTAEPVQSILAAQQAGGLHVAAHALPQQPGEGQLSRSHVAAKAAAPTTQQASASHEAALPLSFQPAAQQQPGLHATAQPAAPTAQQGAAEQEPPQHVSHQLAEAQQLQPHVAAKDSPSTTQEQVPPCNPAKDLPHPPVDAQHARSEAQQAVAKNPESQLLVHRPAVAQHSGSQILSEASAPAAEEPGASTELAEASSNQPAEVSCSGSPMPAEASVLHVTHSQGLGLAGTAGTSQSQVAIPVGGCVHS